MSWLHRAAVGGAAVFYMLVLGGALWPSSRANVWVSPDEAATSAFARAYAQTGEFTLSEPLNPELHGLLGARSMVAKGDTLVPVGFLGLPWIAGVLVWLAKMSPWVLGVVGPLFGTMGVVAWGDAWRRLAGWRVGILSAALVALHPAWLLYASRPLMPNVPFAALLMLSFWAIVARHTRWWGGWLAGFFFAAALTVRTSEIIWLAPLFLGLAYRYRTQVMFSTFTGFAVAACLVVGAFAAQQAATYGDPLISGYTYHDPEYLQEEQAEQGSGGERSVLWSTLLPFGLHERTLLRNGWNYGWLLQWWWSLPATASAVWIAARWKNAASWQRAALFCTIAISVWLTVVYGSWTIIDNPDPTQITLGNSYARYFLPAFVLASPVAAGLLAQKKSVAGATLAIIATLSFNLVIGGPDGWRHVRDMVPTATLKRVVIMEHVPRTAVLIMDRSDKYLVDYHQHLLVPLREPSTYAALPALAARGPESLYYFGLTLPPQDIAHLKEVILQPQGLDITPVRTIEDETLYLLH